MVSGKDTKLKEEIFVIRSDLVSLILKTEKIATDIIWIATDIIWILGR